MWWRNWSIFRFLIHSLYRLAILLQIFPFSPPPPFPPPLISNSPSLYAFVLLSGACRFWLCQDLQQVNVLESENFGKRSAVSHTSDAVDIRVNSRVTHRYRPHPLESSRETGTGGLAPIYGSIQIKGKPEEKKQSHYGSDRCGCLSLSSLIGDVLFRLRLLGLYCCNLYARRSKIRRVDLYYIILR